MSIFKDTFKSEIQDQLRARQDLIKERGSTAVSYFNSRNAWTRMSSAVNVLSTKGGSTNELASKYVLQGGTLSYDPIAKKYSSKSGVGINNAYSTFTPSNASNRFGLKPMPGITSVNVKSLTAYGSLREIEVKFNAWDIRQLEDLELLYMRPGYTVLIEWGWDPYLDKNKTLQTNVDYYDIINPSPKLTKEQIFKDLFEKSLNPYSGNYDAMYGYVKNYSWSSRPDGGYDCSTTIISIGEILESLKVNYSPFNNIEAIGSKGLIAKKVKDISLAKMTDLDKYYKQNILSGLFYEMYQIGMQKMEGTQDEGKSYRIVDQRYERKNENWEIVKYEYNLFKKTININGGENDASSNGKIGASDEQIYITLETLCSVLNNYVIFKDSNTNLPYVKCSVLEREYSKNTPVTTPDSSTGDGYLLCLAHPLQIAIDPTVCVIKNQLWSRGFKVNPNTVIPKEAAGENIKRYSNTNYASLFNKLIAFGANTGASANEKEIINAVIAATGRNLNEFKELQRQYLLIKSSVDKGLNTAPKEVAGVSTSFLNYVKDKRFESFYDLLDDSLTEGQLTTVIIGTEAIPKGKEEAYFNNFRALTLNPSEATNSELNTLKSELDTTQSTSSENLAYLNNIPQPYFYNDSYETELGIIGNIYINLNFLYRLSVDNNLESQDKKEKNDINLYDFLKRVMTEVSSATGGVSNFDIYVDPIDNNIRIIDINYVDAKTREEVFNNLFEFEMHNTKSVIRSYKLESQMFPDQSTTVAIGAQVGGGALATDSNTMLSFNRGLIDRIIPKKIDPTIDPNLNIVENTKSQVKNLISSLKSIYDFFGGLSYNWVQDSDFDADSANNYRNSLKDLINYFKTLTTSNIKNRAIIPTKLSLELDGIGGLVIGHLFKIPDEITPRGYRGGALGSRIGYVVTGVGHSIQNNDWTTNIESQVIVLDEPFGDKIKFSDIIEINDEGNPSTKTAEEIATVKRGTGGGTTKEICNDIRKNGDVEDILVDIRKDLYARHYSPVNQSDGKRIRLQPNAMRALETLLTDAFNVGIYLKVNSAYRTYQDQVRVRATAKLPSATPGTSNHGFGLAVDLANSTGTRINPSLTPKEWQWIQANKNKYNFENINNDSESHHYNFTKPGKNC